MSDSIIKYENIEIHYHLSGIGPPIVLLHGFLENQQIWKYITPFLEKEYQVITIDLLGHGQTGCLNDSEHSMEAMAIAVNTVLETLSIPQVHIVGHSMGGYIALAFAEQYPQKILSIGLMNSTTEADTEIKKKQREQAIELVYAGKKIYTHTAISNLFAKENLQLLAEEISFVQQQAIQTSAEGIVKALIGMKNRQDRTAILRELSISKYIISGEQDPVINPKIALQIARQTACEFISVKGGHMSYIEQSQEVIQTIITYARQ